MQSAVNTLEKVAKHVLFVGFEPFGGEKTDAGALVARSFEGRLIAGRPLGVRVFPAETRNVAERLSRAVTEEAPDVVLIASQAPGRPSIALERLALNVLDFDRPDSVGVMRTDDAVSRGGPAARISTLPLAEIARAWLENGIPGYVSNTPGTGIPNQALYEALGLAEQASPPIVAGLMQLPYLPAQAAAADAATAPSMAIEMMKRAAELALETIIAWVDQRPATEKPGSRAASKPGQVWIPRGVKEVQR